jgi:hypothetical protein
LQQLRLPLLLERNATPTTTAPEATGRGAVAINGVAHIVVRFVAFTAMVGTRVGCSCDCRAVVASCRFAVQVAMALEVQAPTKLALVLALVFAPAAALPPALALTSA